jgi:molybdate transport system substrate-binding protein
MSGKKLCLLIVLILVATGLLVSCGEREPGAVLTIAAASNTQFAMEELTSAFTDQTGIPCHLVTSSSGKLTAQILEGAPYDLLVSADMKYPGQLYEQKRTLGPPRVYAYGRLVLWSLRAGIEPDLGALRGDEIHYIALANPNTAPYGTAAMEVLRHAGLDSVLKEKLVFGESIGQVNQFISSGSAEIGFTAMSVVTAPRFEKNGRWAAVDTSLYSPIEQGVVLIAREGSRQEQARAFADFLFSERARQVLLKYGYGIHE